MRPYGYMFYVVRKPETDVYCLALFFAINGAA